jgi:signal transduction histidine kinase
LLGIVSIGFGAFVYVSQLRDIYGDSRFRIVKKMDDARRAFDSGALIAIQDDDAYALFGASGKILKISGLSEAKADSLVGAALSHKEAFLEGNDGHRGKPIAWVEDKTNSEVLYGYLSLRMSPESAAHNVPEGAVASKADAILFGSPLDPYGLRSRFLITLLIAVAFMLTAAMLSGIWLANRAMRPVAQIARTARSIGEGDLSRRINLGTRDELGELSSVFDSMLDRLETAFERQKRFVADAGHELRTPLSIISLESERALSSTRSADDYKQSLSVVQTECGYMARLVDDLLALAKADSGEAQRPAELVDLGDVAVEAMERYAPLAAGRGVSLSAGELPEVLVRGDRAALATAVGNLVGNAVKYTGPGGHVSVALAADGKDATVRVADDGPGIPEEKLGRVFDRFYRVDESRSEADGIPAGSGLGLAIVKAIAQSHGGEVAVASELGRGSVFSIILPLAQDGDGAGLA